jgi:hypothetical protein
LSPTRRRFASSCRTDSSKSLRDLGKGMRPSGHQGASGSLRGPARCRHRVIDDSDAAPGCMPGAHERVDFAVPVRSPFTVGDRPSPTMASVLLTPGTRPDILLALIEAEC